MTGGNSLICTAEDDVDDVSRHALKIAIQFLSLQRFLSRVEIARQNVFFWSKHKDKPTGAVAVWDKWRYDQQSSYYSRPADMSISRDTKAPGLSIINNGVLVRIRAGSWTTANMYFNSCYVSSFCQRIPLFVTILFKYNDFGHANFVSPRALFSLTHIL